MTDGNTHIGTHSENANIDSHIERNKEAQKQTDSGKQSNREKGL